MELDLVIAGGTLIDGTGQPRYRADLGILNGRIAEGYWADLVVFDPREVRDNGWPERSDLPPSGIDAVLVSGELAAREGKVVSGARRGRVLRKS